MVRVSSMVRVRIKVKVSIRICGVVNCTPDVC